jgi:transposase
MIASADHSVYQVADLFHFSPRTIFRWLARFKKGGIAGLRDRPKGHLK